EFFNEICRGVEAEEAPYGVPLLSTSRPVQIIQAVAAFAVLTDSHITYNQLAGHCLLSLHSATLEAVPPILAEVSPELAVDMAVAALFFEGQMREDERQDHRPRYEEHHQEQAVDLFTRHCRTLNQLLSIETPTS